MSIQEGAVLGRGEEPWKILLKGFKIIFSVTSINSKDAIFLLRRTLFFYIQISDDPNPKTIV
jgi:hypothetical protein